MTEWRIDYSVSVDGEEYEGTVTTTEQRMSESIARNYANHDLHTRSDASIDMFDVTEIDVTYEPVNDD